MIRSDAVSDGVTCPELRSILPISLYAAEGVVRIAGMLTYGTAASFRA